VPDAARLATSRPAPIPSFERAVARALWQGLSRLGLGRGDLVRIALLSGDEHIDDPAQRGVLRRQAYERLVLLREVVEENVRVRSAGEGIDAFAAIDDDARSPPRLFRRADPRARRALVPPPNDVDDLPPKRRPPVPLVSYLAPEGDGGVDDFPKPYRAVGFLPRFQQAAAAAVVRGEGVGRPRPSVRDDVPFAPPSSVCDPRSIWDTGSGVVLRRRAAMSLARPPDVVPVLVVVVVDVVVVVVIPPPRPLREDGVRVPDGCGGSGGGGRRGRWSKSVVDDTDPPPPPPASSSSSDGGIRSLYGPGSPDT